MWPPDYQEQLSGRSCRLCAEGRPEEIAGCIRDFPEDAVRREVALLRSLLAEPG